MQDATNTDHAPSETPTGAASCEPVERWRPVPGVLPIEVSTLGRIRHLTTGRIVRPNVVLVKRTQPRLQVTIRMASRIYYRRVARLVCETWHGDPGEDQVAMFIDGDSMNCTAENVKWASRKEVSQATVARGRHKSGQQVLAERRRAQREQHSRC